ncbi:MAG: tRNA (adenosine(37)-N6)-threonylcarbamoyltransferase complex dimerization subunit type 1 TsaB [Parvibaculales bacterium]
MSDGDARVMPETVLACDTTQGACSAALWHKGAPVAERLVKMQRGHAEALLPVLGEIKREAPDIWAQINVLAVTVGPGTFTGVRVGLSAMRGLSLAMGVPVAGFGTLHMMALASTSPHRRLVAVDARRDTFYTQICAPDGTACEPPTARSLAACLALGAEDDDPKFAVIGTGAAAICTPENSRFSADSAPHWPQARVLAAHAAGLSMDALTALPATPLYLRPPDATLPDPQKNLVFVPANDGTTAP